MRKLLGRIKRKVKRELHKAETFLQFRINGTKRWLRQSLIYCRAVHAPELSEQFRGIFEVGVAADVIDNWDHERAEIGCWGKEALIAHCFSAVVCENAMKPEYNFDPNAEDLFHISDGALRTLQYARAHNLKIRVHVLVWHKQTDEAIFCRDFQPVYDQTGTLRADCLVSREILLERLNRYISGFVRYIYKNGYADLVYAYDVVNEATSNHPGQLYRDSYWYRIIGPDYIYFSFRYTREAIQKYSLIFAGQYHVGPDPDSLKQIQGDLLYCDNYEWLPEKQEKIIRILKETVMNCEHEEEKLLDGIGMQGHITLDTDTSMYLNAMKRYGLEFGSVHVTELDICSGEIRKTGYAEKYKEIFEGFLDTVTQGIRLVSVTLWGLNDGRSWQKEKHCSLLFDDTFRAKEELYSISHINVRRQCTEKQHS